VALLASACGAGVSTVHGHSDELPPPTTAHAPASVFVADHIALPVMSVTDSQPGSYVRAGATVYQPADQGDAIATPFLAAMFAPGEDCCSSFPGLQGPRVEHGFHGLRVQSRPGAVGSINDNELIVWTTPPTSQESDEAAVLAAGVTDAQVRRAAGGSRADEHGATIVASALPAGYRAVATGPINIGLGATAGGFAVRYGNTSASVLVETATGDDHLLAMARATMAGRHVQIAGHDAWVGPALIDDLPVQRYVWRTGHDIVAVDAQGVSADQVQQVIASLRREPKAQALHDLQAQVGTYPAQQLARPGEEVAVSLQVGGGVAAVVVEASKSDKLLVQVTGVGLPPDALGIGTGWSSNESHATWASVGAGQALIFGSTPLRAKTVVLVAPNGRTYPATLGHVASRPGLTFFAAIVRQHGDPPNYRVSARDANGHTLASWPVT